ncbi:RHS repeat-associated core domain-containing protein [Nocardia otitidiscaviarum]|uniref:RHS repeat-associated core domain-containing protein n=1 Tax=Nocardia otitidiscaviarum TaxID=1823 RepID=UPI003F69E358
MWTPDQQWWHYTYDALGRRTSKQHLATDNSVLESAHYIWHATHLIEQVGTDSTTRWHYRPASYIPITQSTRESGADHEFSAIVTDLTGNPVELFDSLAGKSVSTAIGSLWGNISWSGTTTSALRFPGQIHDPETGLHHSLHRVYDPSTGRFQTQDPLGLRPAPNPSAYPHNPTRWIDPLGLTPEDGCPPNGGCSNGGSWDRTESEYLYRGVPYADGNPFFEDWQRAAYENAQRGIANPRWGPNADANAHAGGDTDSPFTSWTTDYENVALGASMEGPGPGIVMRIPNTDGPGYYRVPGVSYLYDESEVTILGRVHGAEISINGGPWTRPN